LSKLSGKIWASAANAKAAAAQELSNAIYAHRGMTIKELVNLARSKGLGVRLSIEPDEDIRVLFDDKPVPQPYSTMPTLKGKLWEK
jgi:hypothetical protein